MDTNLSTTQESASNVIATTNDQAEPGILDSILVTYDTRVTRKNSEAQRQPLSWVVNQILTSADLQESVAIIRGEPSIDRRHDLEKKLLPYFTFLQFSNNIRKKEFFQRVEFMLMDLDHVSDRIDELRGKMRQDPNVFLFFVSPSGDGLKVVFALDREITSAIEYRDEVYRRFRVLVKEPYGVETDDIKDVAQACFLSYDPDLYVNPSAIPLSPTIGATQSKQVPKGKVGDSIIMALQGTTPGMRTHSMTELVGLYISKGFDREFTLEFIRNWNRDNDPPHSDEKLIATVNDMFDRYDKGEKYRNTWSYETDILQAGIIGEDWEEWLQNGYTEPSC